jgi:hypothetical protein
MKRRTMPPRYRTWQTRHATGPVFGTYGKPRRRPAWDRKRPKGTPGRFTVTGYIPIGATHPHRVTATWRRGRLSGSPELVVAAIDRATGLDGERVGPVEGPATRHDHLASPLSACIIISALFIHGTQRYSGDVPMRPAIPRGQ